MRLGGREAAGGAVALAGIALFVRLGVWQVHRLEQRRARNAVVAARRELPPLLLDGSGVPLDSARDRRVRAQGRYDYAGERLWVGRSYDGTPGVAVLTPLRLPGGSAVYVDRGWVPSPDGVHIDQAAVREGGGGGDTVTVEGLAYAAPRSRGDVDVARVRDSISYPLLPFVVQQTPAVRPPNAPPLPAGPPYRWPVPALDDGPHLSYAVQWFSFALITLVGTAALLRKTARDASRPTI